MPFLGKMTSRLRGLPKEDESDRAAVPASSSKSRTFLGSPREPMDKSTLEGSRNKVSRKDSKVNREDRQYRRSMRGSDSQSYGDRNGGASSSSGHVANVDYGRDDDDEDPDLMYRRSREHFASWNIQDIMTGRESPSSSPTFDSTVDEAKLLNSDRKSRFDAFKASSNDGTTKRSGRTVSNGNLRSKYRSPSLDDANKKKDGRPRDESLKFAVKRGDILPARDARSSSLSSSILRDKKKRNSSSPSDGAVIRRSKSPPHHQVREIDSGINSPRYDDGDTERAYRYDRNRSSRNSGERYRLLHQEVENLADSYTNEYRNPCSADERPSTMIRGRYSGGGVDRSPSSLSHRENDQIRQLIDRFKSSHSNDPPNENERYEKRCDPANRSAVADDDDGFGSMDRKYSRRNSTRDDEDGDHRKKADPTRRRSRVRSDSPDGFDVQIQRYERPGKVGDSHIATSIGPRIDNRSNDSSVRDAVRVAESSSRRRDSFKLKEYGKDDCPADGESTRNGRHNRLLTPPEERRAAAAAVATSSSAVNSQEWREGNRKFAVQYLRENSKVRPTHHRRDNEEPLDGGRPEIESSTFEEQNGGATYFGERRRASASFTDREPVGTNRIKSRRYPTTGPADASADHRQTRMMRIEPSVTIRIRESADEVRPDNDGPLKRGPFVNEENATRPRNGRSKSRDDECLKRERRRSRDKDCRTGVSTPARKIWNYREGGVQITDVDEGQPCLKCGDACDGFLQHAWRKNCNSCKCPREAHDVCHEEWVSVRSRLGLKGDEASGSVACDLREMGLAWAPPGLPPHKVDEYFSMLPERSVPRLGTPGERYRDRQLAMQLPKQDLAKAYCRHLAREHYTSADDFMAARNEIALDIGTVQEILESGASCAGCNESLKYGSLAVSAGKLGELYHPGCFQCVQCRELLVDLAYCVHNDAIYCERHYAERLKGRCAACDELIFSGEFTRAMNKDWHSGHFCCWQCDESLTGQRYVLRDEHPYCIKCYESVFANGCEECSKIIGIDSKDLSYKDKHWHEACFLCNKCRVSLVDKQFGSKVDKIYCGNCYDAQFASRCDGCGEIFRAGTKKMEYKTRQWHEKCFCCVVCKNPIGTKSFIPREQEIYCAGCYEDKFATRCVKCNKIITSGGVTYKNEPWHRECFTCSNCSTSLAGQRFTSRDEKPYCAECFGELFAKRCTACTKPITGIGGTRFISFEDRHWHNDCFICAGCKTSLVGHGFITDGDDIICPECAKQKLM